MAPKLPGKDDLDYSNRRKKNKRFMSPDPRQQEDHMLLYYLNQNIDSPPQSPKLSVHSPTKRIEDPYWNAYNIRRNNIVLQ